MSVRFFLVYDLETGKALRAGSVTPCPEIDLIAAQAMPGEAVIETEAMCDPHKVAVDPSSRSLIPIRDTRPEPGGAPMMGA
jgi:hypothetical protein